MASPLTLLPDPAPGPVAPGSAAARFVQAEPVERTRHDEFPKDPVFRWVLRLLLAAPLIGVAFLVNTTARPAAGSPNAELLARIAHLDWSHADPVWFGQLYPPFTTLIAAILPGGQFGLAIVSSLLAGYFLQKMLEMLVQRQFSVSTSALIMIAVAVNPLFFYLILENFSAAVGLGLFGLGIVNAVRFMAWGNTRAGFAAGILFMLATLSDLPGMVYVLTALAATPFLKVGRFSKRSARASNVLVLAYPTIGAFVAIGMLNLVFTHRLFDPRISHLLGGTLGRLDQLPSLLGTPFSFMLIASVACAWALGLILLRPASLLVSTLVAVAVIVGWLLGLLSVGAEGNVYFVLLLIALSMFPSARRHTTAILINMVVVAQIAIAWNAAFTLPVVSTWLHTVTISLAVVPH